jgi:hypothetical protein
MTWVRSPSLDHGHERGRSRARRVIDVGDDDLLEPDGWRGCRGRTSMSTDGSRKGKNERNALAIGLVVELARSPRAVERRFLSLELVVVVVLALGGPLRAIDVVRVQGLVLLLLLLC